VFSTPDFLVIGPKKTGTTWLYSQLNMIEGFSMPPFKEVSFFYDADIYELIRDYKEGKDMRNKLPEVNITPELIKRIKLSRMSDRIKNFKFVWDARKYFWAVLFFAIPRSFNLLSLFLYTRLFSKKNKDVVTGDISPAYFTLSLDAVLRIKKYFPKIKILFIIRDPVDREWSQIRMTYFEHKNSGPFTLEKYMAVQNYDGDYKRAIEKWESVFEAGSIYFTFYDDLVADPQQFIERIVDFLKPGAKITEVLRQRVDEGVPLEMDSNTRYSLYRKNMAQYQFLKQKFPASAYPAKWHQTAIKEAENEPIA
jgi:hypothetical protein